MIDLDIWCHRALASVFSLWQDARCCAWRSSQDRVSGDMAFRPTVTCNAILAFDDYGLFSSPVITLPTDLGRPDVLRIQKVLFHAGQDQLDGSAWIGAILGNSAHKIGKRQIILLSNLFSAVHALARRQALTPDQVQHLTYGLNQATEIVSGIVIPSSVTDSVIVAESLENDPYWSPYLALYTRSYLLDRSRLAALCVEVPASTRQTDLIDKALLRYFEREVDRIMARRGVPGDSGFDAASLAFAFKGLLSYRDDEFRETPFYQAVVEAIIKHQNQDGTWPDGVTAISEVNADTLQQPSVKIGLTLAHCVFEPRMLVRFRSGEMSSLERALPALIKLAEYLVSTYVVSSATNTSGWASDRVRWPNTAETWITVLVSRFLLNVRFACRAVKRAETLRRFTTRMPRAEASPESRRETWDKLLEPCEILLPMKCVADSVIEPILRQQQRDQAIVRPDENGVSMIICGPPGSGKTFFVSQLSEALSWPVVELSPGSFVSQGAELIESKAAEIFSVLHELDHAIVFFDECDELFLERSQQQFGFRNILSFVTASMLPKLQQLHDRRSVVLIVATNYLHRIDKAIRRPGRFDLVLLLDRPDRSARLKLLAKALDSTDVGLIAKRADQTAGLTMKEVLDYIKLGPKEHAPPAGSRVDYVEWCRTDAKLEIDATRASINEIRRIKNRWDTLIRNFGQRAGNAKAKTTSKTNASKRERPSRNRPRSRVSRVRH